MYDVFTYFAWFVLALLFTVVVCAIVWLGSLPKKIALRRNHPQVDAINALSWFGLLLGGVGWVVAFVWALLRSGSWGYSESPDGTSGTLAIENSELRSRITKLEKQLAEANKTEMKP